MSAVQLNILQAIQERDAGILKAVTSAENNCPGWADKAYNMLVEWLRPWPRGFRFQIEEFRKIAHIKGLPEPPSARAYGSLAVRARKEGLIISNGQKATSGATAHRAYANEWQKV